MKTLELKDIAAYLPYGLKSMYKNTPRYGAFDMQIGKMYKSGVLSYFVEENEIPLLRPMSDLTKEITHRGEKFVPMDRIRAISRCFELDDCGLLFMRNGCTQSEWICVLDKLSEWMFDFRGLIPAGLAVDVNTLDQNPYEE